MKKYTAFLSTFLILLMLVFTGCSSNSEPVATTKPTPVKNTISPTANVETTLDNDTIFDEQTYSIIIPKDAKLQKKGNMYSWTITTDDYIIMVSISLLGKTITSKDIIASDTNLSYLLDLVETSSGNAVKMDRGYKKTTFVGKNAICLSGKFINDVNGDMDANFIETDNGLIGVITAKVYFDSSDKTKTEANKAINDIISTMTIK